MQAMLVDSSEKHTISIYFVNAALMHVTSDGRTRALAAAGIAPQLLEIPYARVPATAYSLLWLAVARELDDEFFRLDRRSMKVGSFALICQAVLPCSDLDRAIKRMTRAFALFLDEVKAELSLEDGDAIIRLTNSIEAEPARRFADETLLVLLHGLMCWLAGRRIALKRVTFAHDRPPYAREYTLMFCERLTFNAPQTTLRFDGAALASPVVQDPKSLHRFLLTAPQSVFLKYRNEDSWGARLRQRLRGSVGEPETWPVFEALASEFGVAATTLRRRLDREGVSYQTIKDQLRNDVAIHYLCNTALSVDEVAAHLGFQDASAFHRAFKRWNGVQPGEYRRRRNERSVE